MSPWRNGALSPYPASASTQPNRNANSLQSRRITRPVLGKEKAQRHHHEHFASGKRQRHQRLAVGGLAKRRSILRSYTDRVLALLRHRRVVDHQHRVTARRRIFADALNIQLQGKDQFFGVAGQPPVNLDWQNPRGALPARRAHIV